MSPKKKRGVRAAPTNAELQKAEAEIKAELAKMAQEPEDNWQHRAQNMRCQTCMWYVPKSEKIGRCRHTSPTIKGWPVLFPTDWCGDHRLDENSL